MAKDTKYYIDQFEYQQEISRRIRALGKQLMDDASNIAMGALNVSELTIILNVVDSIDGLGCLPEIEIQKNYIPKSYMDLYRNNGLQDVEMRIGVSDDDLELNKEPEE